MHKTWLLCSALLLVASACGKPSEDECKAALQNLRQIVEQNPNATVAPSMVEECQKNDSKARVECNRNAKTSEDLDKCLEL